MTRDALRRNVLKIAIRETVRALKGVETFRNDPHVLEANEQQFDAELLHMFIVVSCVDDVIVNVFFFIAKMVAIKR